jgi:hypothetical protein
VQNRTEKPLWKGQLLSCTTQGNMHATLSSCCLLNSIQVEDSSFSNFMQRKFLAHYGPLGFFLGMVSMYTNINKNIIMVENRRNTTVAEDSTTCCRANPRSCSKRKGKRRSPGFMPGMGGSVVHVVTFLTVR